MNYSINKTVNIQKLIGELSAFPIVSITPEHVTTSVELTQQQVTDMEAIITAHNPVDAFQLVRNRILNAMEFGRGIIAEYGASNVLANLTIAEIQTTMTATEKVQSALNTGSMYVAIQEINAIVPDGVLITTAKLTEVRNKIEDYLQIPRT